MRMAGEGVLVCEPMRMAGGGESSGDGGGDGADGPSGARKFLDRFRGGGEGYGVLSGEGQEVRRSGIRTPPGLQGRSPGYGASTLEAIAESEGEDEAEVDEGVEVAGGMDGSTDVFAAFDEAAADSESSWSSGSGSSVETVIASGSAPLEWLGDAGASGDEGADVVMGTNLRRGSLSSDATIADLETQNDAQRPGVLSDATGDLRDSEMADTREMTRCDSCSSAATFDDGSVDYEMAGISARVQSIPRAQRSGRSSDTTVGEPSGQGR